MISVVMPAHNEEGYLDGAVKKAVARMRDAGQPFEIVVVENGSTDRTAEQARTLADAYPEVSALRSAEANYGRALRAGFLAARGEIVVNFDVDLVDLDFLDRALAAMTDPGVAIVVGSKRVPGSEDRRRLGRKLVTGVFSLVLRLGFGLGVSDTHGLKALRRAAVLPVVEACLFGEDIFDTELIVRAERSGLKVIEIPVVVADVRPPRTPIATRIPRTLVGLARLRVALFRT